MLESKYFARVIGILIITAGLILNEWILGKLLADNGTIDKGIVLSVIRSFNVLMIVLGLSIIIIPDKIKSALKWVLPILKNVCIIIVITLILYFVVDYIFGLLNPIRPWEMETNIMTAPVKSLESYYTKDFMMEQYNSSKKKYWSAPSDTRLVFKREFRGKYINTEKNTFGAGKVYRKTINQTKVSDPNVKKVLMLGGSTLYCLEVPDSLTVSSILSKKLNKFSLDKYFVANEGVESDTSIQEVTRLKLELQAGFRPDVVIAYHGFNEINGGVYLDDPEAVIWENMVRTNYKTFFLNIITGKFLRGNIYNKLVLESEKKKSVIRTIPEYMYDSEKIKKLSAAAKKFFIYNNMEMYKLSKQYGFKYYSILQPTQAYGNYNKNELDIKTVKTWAAKFEPKIYEAFKYGYPELIQAVKELKSKGVDIYDLSNIFITKDNPVYVDTVHVNSIGNEKVAEEMKKIILNK